MIMRMLQNRYGQPGGIGNVIADAAQAADFVEDPVGSTLGEIREEAWSRGDVGTALGTTALENLVMLGVADESEPVARDWLVPGFGGLYYTPNEPVDPRDCDRWPDSPYCGGTGITSDFGNLGTGLGIDISISNCEQCITVNQSLAFIALPPYTVCHRFDNGSCRPAPQQPAVPEPQDEEVPRLGPIQNAYNPPGFCRVVVGHSSRFWTNPLDSRDQQNDSAPLLAFGGIMPPQSWVSQTVSSHRWQRSGAYKFAIAYYLVQELRVGIIAIVTSRQEAEALVAINPRRRYFGLSGGLVITNETAYRDFPHGFQLPGTAIPIHQATVGQVMQSLLADDSLWGLGPPHMGGDALVAGVPWGLLSFPCARIEPPPQPEGGLMPCSCEDNEEMLRAIYNRLGVEDYPVELPASLFDNSEEEIEVESNAQYLTWLVQQMDGLVGQFPIELEIEDIDSLAEGNQRQKIKLPNLAELLAELYTLALKLNFDNGVTTEFLTRLSSEVISTKVAATVAQEYAKANASFLGYEGNPVNRNIDLNFNPDLAEMDNIRQLFRSSRKKYKGWKNESRETVLDYLQKAQFIHGILKETFFRGFDRLDDLQEELGQVTEDRSQRESNWEQFIDEVEGVGTVRNVGEPRPRVTDLSLDDLDNLNNDNNQASTSE